MKPTLNTRTLRRLGACSLSYDKFKAAHGYKTVTLTEAFHSNGWDDAWWYLRKAEKTKAQNADLRLLTCDYAERVLPIFEAKYPDDNRPRQAIETARRFAVGKATKEELKEARSAAYAYAYAAAYAAAAAAYAAADAYAYAYAAAYAAAAAAACTDTGAAERKWQIEKLLELFAKWEQTK